MRRASSASATWCMRRRGRRSVARAQGGTVEPGRSETLPREKSTAMTAGRCAPSRSAASDTYDGDAGNTMHGSNEAGEADRDAAAKPGQKAADGENGMTTTPLVPSARALARARGTRDASGETSANSSCAARPPCPPHGAGSVAAGDLWPARKAGRPGQAGAWAPARSRRRGAARHPGPPRRTRTRVTPAP